MRTVTITITVPNDYDLDPLMHRIEDTLDGIQTGTNEFDGNVEPSMQCPELEYTIMEK